MTWTGAPSMVEPLAFRALPSLSPWKHVRVRALAKSSVYDDDGGACWSPRVAALEPLTSALERALLWAFNGHEHRRRVAEDRRRMREWGSDWLAELRPPSTEAGR